MSSTVCVGLLGVCMGLCFLFDLVEAITVLGKGHLNISDILDMNSSQ